MGGKRRRIGDRLRSGLYEHAQLRERHPAQAIVERLIVQPLERSGPQLIVAGRSARGSLDEIDHVASSLLFQVGAAPALRNEVPAQGQKHHEPITGDDVESESFAQGQEFNPSEISPLDSIVAGEPHVETLSRVPAQLGAGERRRHVDRVSNEHGLGEGDDRISGDRPAGVAAVSPVERRDEFGVSLGVADAPPRQAPSDRGDEIAPRLPAGSRLGQSGELSQSAVQKMRQLSGTPSPTPPLPANGAQCAPNNPVQPLVLGRLRLCEEFSVHGKLTTEMKRLQRPTEAKLLYVLQAGLHGGQGRWHESELERHADQGQIGHAIGVKDAATSPRDILEDLMIRPSHDRQGGADVIG